MENLIIKLNKGSKLNQTRIVGVTYSDNTSIVGMANSLTADFYLRYVKAATEVTATNIGDRPMEAIPFKTGSLIVDIDTAVNDHIMVYQYSKSNHEIIGYGHVVITAENIKSGYLADIQDAITMNTVVMAAVENANANYERWLDNVIVGVIEAVADIKFGVKVLCSKPDNMDNEMFKNCMNKIESFMHAKKYYCEATYTDVSYAFINVSWTLESIEHVNKN